MRPMLETSRLLLRGFVEADLPRLLRLAGRREIADTMISIPHPYSEDYARQWLVRARVEEQRGEGVHFAICEAVQDSLVGAIELRAIDTDHQQAELSFWVGVDHWGLGYATEAAARVLGYGFDQLRLNRIYAHHMLRNPASGAVLARLGLQREGVLRQRVKKWGVFEDVALWAILRDDPDCGRRQTEPVPGLRSLEPP